MDTLVKAGVKETKITSGVVTISISMEALKEIQEQVGADITVTATKVENDTLSEEAKELVGDRPVYDLSISDKDGTKVTDFGNGTISVSIPYTLGANENPDNVVAYYIDSTGKITEMPNSVYDPITKTLSFVTSHFSMYGVVYKATEDIKETVTDDSIDSNTASNEELLEKPIMQPENVNTNAGAQNGIALLVLIVLLAAVAVAGFVIYKRKKH